MSKAWYVVHTYSGFENKAKQALEERIKLYGLGPRFGQVLVPTEEVVEVKNGQKKTTTRKFFPGYILVEMEMDNQTWHVVKETPKVTGFVGQGRNPPPMRDEEVKRITARIGGEEQKPKLAVNFERGEEVRVVDGPLAPVVGKVEEVNSARGRLRVTVTIFGRPTSVELDFTQVEKVG
ncbi:MAG: transcription termination/antitermination protein NusG [Deltaproteobacteria bacterium]|nr:transcription termination/antitermination protein NusG [Deltaproteobacteria bacterium]